MEKTLTNWLSEMKPLPKIDEKDWYALRSKRILEEYYLGKKKLGI